MQSSVLVASVVLTVAVLTSVASGADPSDVNMSLVSASASAEQFVATSLTEVSLSISIERMSNSSEQGESALDKGLVQAGIDANLELGRRSSHLIGLLQTARVEKLRKISSSLEQMYEAARPIGVRLRQGLLFRTNINRFGEVLMTVMQEDGIRIEGVSLVASDEELELASSLAIRQAVQKAKSRALLALLEAGCAGLSGLHSVTVSSQAARIRGEGLQGAATTPLSSSMSGDSALAGGSALGALPMMGGEYSIMAQAMVTLRCVPGVRR